MAAGTPWRLWEAVGGPGAAAVLGLWGGLALAALRPRASEIRGAVLGLGPCVLVPVILFLAGQVASRVAAESGPIARVSLGSAVWLQLLALPILFLDTLQRERSGRWRLSAAAVLSGVAVAWIFASGAMDHLSIMKEFAHREERFLGELRTHLALSGGAVGTALLLGFPLGVLAHRRAALRGPTFFTLNILQTIPSLALFGILIPVLAAVTEFLPALEEWGVRGIGTAPALIALTIYSILPVARNTYIGFRAVEPAAVDAGLGMGMTRGQLLLRVELPIASPILLNGIRIALVQAIGLTAVAALIGAGGFGVFIFQGLGQAATDLILLGAIPTVLVAVAADGVMNGLIRLLRPRGLQ